MKKYLLYVSWVQALVATVGSLYFSEIKHFLPCSLCWYQRIFIYPLVLLIPVGIISKDKKRIPLYVLSLAIPGTLIAFWHNLVYWKIISETTLPCFVGVSCTTKYVEFFGFVTIPLLSFLAFLLIDVCMVVYLKLKK